MKKFAFAFVMVAALVVALMSTSSVFAQGPVQTNPQAPGSAYSYGRGAMGARGGVGLNASVDDGILHDGMIAVYAEQLGISVDDLNARLENGETISQIAVEKGLTAEQFTTLMNSAREQAVAQAVQDGTLTQEQADWMNQRGGAFGSAGTMGAGAVRGGRGVRGTGLGIADCPVYP